MALFGHVRGRLAAGSGVVRRVNAGVVRQGYRTAPEPNPLRGGPPWLNGSILGNGAWSAFAFGFGGGGTVGIRRLRPARRSLRSADGRMARATRCAGAR